MNDSLTSFLWGLKQGESLSLTVESLQSEPLERYGLEYSVIRGPIPDHWLYNDFDPSELELFFVAKDHEGIAHGWLLFEESQT